MNDHDFTGRLTFDSEYHNHRLHLVKGDIVRLRNHDEYPKATEFEMVKYTTHVDGHHWITLREVLREREQADTGHFSCRYVHVRPDDIIKVRRPHNRNLFREDTS